MSPKHVLYEYNLLTDWTMTAYGYDPVKAGKSDLVLPLVVYYLTPTPVGILGKYQRWHHI